jgi:hypothetical protein
MAAGIALMACGGGGDTRPSDGPGFEPPPPAPTPAPTPAPPPPAPPPAAPLYTLAPATNPLTVTSTLDTPRAVSTNMSTEGGTLTATGADGTVYRLSVDKDALYEPVTITMTPLASLGNMPFGEAMRGVRLEPVGLKFNAHVRLDIQARAGQEWPIAQQIAIGLYGANQQLNLAPLDHGSETPSLMLMHFSSYAIVLSRQGLNASLSGLRERLGGDAEQRLSTALAEELQRERQIQLTGRPDGGLTDLVENLFHQYHQQVLLPRLAAASGSCAASRLAIQTLAALQRDRQLLGLTPDDPAFAPPDLSLLITDGAKVCMKEEFEVCRDHHIITRMAPKAMSMTRLFELFGRDPTQVPEIEAYAEKCLRFELQLDSTFTSVPTVPPSPDSDLLRMSETVRSRIPLRLISLTSVMDSAALQSDWSAAVPTAYSASLQASCSTVTATTPGNSGVKAQLSWRAKAGDSVSAATADDFLVALNVDVDAAQGFPGSSFTARYSQRGSDGKCSTPYEQTAAMGWGTLGSSLLSELQYHPGSTVFGLTGWTVGGNDDARVATKDLDHSVPGDTSTVRLQAHLVLVHQPASN